MKFSVSLLLVCLGLSLSACNTLVTRRDLYSPKKGSGPWTDRLADYQSREGIFGMSHNHRYGRPGSEEGIFGISRNEDEGLLLEEESEQGIFGVSRNVRD